MENLSFMTSFYISNRQFHLVLKQITLEMKLNDFTIDCSKENVKITLTIHFINALRNNDYLTSITRHLNCNNKSQKLNTHSNTYFLKLPHFSGNYHQINMQGYLQGRARCTTGPLATLTTAIPNEKKNSITVITCTSSQPPNRRS